MATVTGGQTRSAGTPANGEAASAANWVRVFNTFDSQKNNIQLILQSGDWVQSIHFVKKLEAVGSVIRFSYGQDSRREYRGVVDASALKMIIESPL